MQLQYVSRRQKLGLSVGRLAVAAPASYSPCEDAVTGRCASYKLPRQ